MKFRIDPSLRFGFALLCLLGGEFIAHENQHSTFSRDYTVALFSALSNTAYGSFLRIINYSPTVGEVHIVAYDDDGKPHGPLSFTIESNAAFHLDSADLEQGNSELGLRGNTGAGNGDWHLVISSELDLDVLSYLQSGENFIVATHETTQREAQRVRLPIFEPGSDSDVSSHLRITNYSADTASVRIMATDDLGHERGPGVSVKIPPHGSRTYTAAELESGAREDIRGSFGDGTGRWRLVLESEQDIAALNLIASSEGYISNLSTPPVRASDGVYSIPLFPSVSNDERELGFVRLINQSDRSGTINIQPYDDSNHNYDLLALSIGANEAKHVHSEDLEFGNSSLGLSGSTGAGTGTWRLNIDSDLPIQVLAYLQFGDGFFTAIHESVIERGDEHQVVIFHPAQRSGGSSVLRFVNQSDETSIVIINGVDDTGQTFDGSVRIELPPKSAMSVSRDELLKDFSEFQGSFGNLEGTLRLSIGSTTDIHVMNLFIDEAGRVSNLSAAPPSHFAPIDELAFREKIATDWSVLDGAGIDLHTRDGRFSSLAENIRRGGEWHYNRISRNKARIDLNFDDDEQCAVHLYYSSPTSFFHSGLCGTRAPVSFIQYSKASTLSDADIPPSFQLDAANSDAVGVAYANGLLYVPDTNGHVYIYTTAGERRETDEFDLDTDNSDPQGIVVANGHTYIVDATDLRVYVYGSSGERNSDLDFEIDNYLPEGITYANNRLYIVDAISGVHAYLLTGERDTTRDFRTTTANLFPTGITFAHDRFYVVDLFRDKVFAYTSAGVYAPEFDFVLNPDASLASGITHDGQWFFVVHYLRNQIWAYSGDEQGPDGPDLIVELADSMPLEVDPAETFELSVVVRNVGTMTSPASVVRFYESDVAVVTESSSEIAVEELAMLEPDQSHEFTITVSAPDVAGRYYYSGCVDSVPDEIDESSNCSHALRVTVNGSVISPEPDDGLIASVIRLEVDVPVGLRYRGLAYTEDGLYAVRGSRSAFDVHGFDSSVERNVEIDFRLDRDNADAERIAYANDKLYVIDGEDNRVYVYDLVGNRLPSFDFDLDATAFSPDGLTFGEGMFYVVDEGGFSRDRLFAYSIEGERVPAAEFDLHEDNVGTVGIAYANGRLFVLDSFDRKVYAYTITGQRLPAFDFALGSEIRSPEALTYGDRSFFVIGREAIYVYSFEDGAGISAPDLASTIPLIDRSVAPENIVTLRATVTNHGDRTSVESTLRYYQSTDTTIDSTDVELGSDAVLPLDPQIEREYTFEFESSADLGTYYYGACVDSVTEEALTTNNCSSSMRVVVADRGGADLSVVSMQPPQRIWTRHPFNISVAVRNQGDVETPESSLRFYRSDDAEISADDVEVAQMTLNSLLPGTERRFETTLFSPIEPGTYYYGACADSVSREPDVANNCAEGIEISSTMRVCSFNLDDDHGAPSGIAHANGTLFVPSGYSEPKVFTYSTSGERLTDADFSLSSTHDPRPYQARVRATFASQTLYVLDGGESTVFGYTASGDRVSSADFDLGIDDSEGITFADGYLYFVDADGGSSLRAYTLEGERVPTADLDLDSYNSDPTGVEFADSLFYVLDGVDQKAYAYDASGTRVSARDFELDATNTDPRGIAFDGNGIHIVDGSDARVYSYPLGSESTSTQPCFREGSRTRRGMFENSPPGINVGDPVRTNGTDSARYTLAGPDASQFEIVELTGQIRTVEGELYDFETTDEYEVEVNVSYDDTSLDTIDVTIEIYDERADCFGSRLDPRIVAGDGLLALYWSPLAEEEGVASTVGYETEIRQGFFDDWSDRRTFITTGRSHAIYTGLENGVEYDIQLRPINAERDCPWFAQISGIPTQDLAPQDDQEHVDRFGPRPIGSTDRNFRLLAPSRCRHTLDGVRLDAKCTYERTGPNAASILLKFDDPSKGSCSVSLAYSSLTTGSFIDECFDAGVNTNVDFDLSIRMPTDDFDELPNAAIPRSPRSQEEFDVFAWGREDLIPGLGFGCPPGLFVNGCEFYSGRAYLNERDEITGLRRWTLGEYQYENTGPTTGHLTFRSDLGHQYDIVLEFEPSGHIRTTITESGVNDFGWPGMPHIDLELGAQTILLPVPPSWEALLALESDFANVDENLVHARLRRAIFPDFVRLVTGAQGLSYQQEYMKVGRNRAVQTFGFPRRPDWVFDSLPAEERARKQSLNGSSWTVILDFNSDGSAFVTSTHTNDGFRTTTSTGFIDFLGENVSLEVFPDELLLPDEAPQESGEDLSDVSVAIQATVAEIDGDDFQTMVISASDVEFNMGDWLEPKDGGNQRMMVVASEQVAAAKPSIMRTFSGSRVKQRFDASIPPMTSDQITVPRTAASRSPNNQVDSNLAKLTVVCMQFDRDIPTRGARYFSKPKVASDDVQNCQKECVLAGGDEIQSCVWNCE